jgi:hypothetical protein
MGREVLQLVDLVKHRDVAGSSGHHSAQRNSGTLFAVLGG